MPQFIKIRIGNRSFAFDLTAIESVDLQEKKVFTKGSDEPYTIYDDRAWRIIMRYVNDNREQTEPIITEI